MHAMPRAILTDLIAEQPLVESWTPLHRSQLWQLNRKWWQRQGARAWLNLAYCDAQAGDLAAALGAIARALAADRSGALTSELLARQQEIIGRLAQRSALE